MKWLKSLMTYSLVYWMTVNCEELRKLKKNIYYIILARLKLDNIVQQIFIIIIIFHIYS